ncbi:MAG TPA: NADH-quinone oxidoreductase subunit NuoK [Planctomycetota bacterium]|nr:NADH-quinone oxidoreductase subunit NuoK [Planctomycetota bacterium]
MEWITGGPNVLTNYLILSGFLFACGIFAMVSRRNAVGILMGVELILNAAGINFVAFSRFGHDKIGGDHLDGQIFTLFIIILAAAEAAVALALVLAVFQTHKTIALNDVDEMQM